MASRRHESNPWNPTQILNLARQRDRRCIGKAKTQGRECRNSIAQGDWYQAFYLLGELATVEPESEGVRSALKEIARLLLCKRWHGVPGGKQEQIVEVVGTWMAVITRHFNTVQVVVQEETSRQAESQPILNVAPRSPITGITRRSTPFAPLLNNTVERRFDAIPTPSPEPPTFTLSETEPEPDRSRYNAEQLSTPTRPRSSTVERFGLPTPPSFEPSTRERTSFPIPDLPTPPSSQPRSENLHAELVAGDGSPIRSANRRPLPTRTEQITLRTASADHNTDSSQDTRSEQRRDNHTSPVTNDSSLLARFATNNVAAGTVSSSITNDDTISTSCTPNLEPTGFPRQLTDRDLFVFEPDIRRPRLAVRDHAETSSARSRAVPGTTVQGLETYNPAFSFRLVSALHSDTVAEHSSQLEHAQRDQNAASSDDGRVGQFPQPVATTPSPSVTDHDSYGQVEILLEPPSKARVNHDLSQFHVDTTFINDELSNVPTPRCGIADVECPQLTSYQPITENAQSIMVSESMHDYPRISGKKSRLLNIWDHIIERFQTCLPCFGRSTGD